jgi:hypothetical protein
MKPTLVSLFYLTLSTFVYSQNALFAPYDCRAEVEILNRIEREQRERQMAYEDSLKRAELALLELRNDEYRKIMEDTVNGWIQWSTVANYTFGKDRGSLPMINDLSALHPYFRDRVNELIRRCKARGIELAVVETYRTHAKQSEYKSMGRKYTRSGAGKSKHQYGLAVDVVPLIDGVPQWHNKKLWYKIGVQGEQLGLRWGGRWRSLYDPGHFEWTGGLDHASLAKGKLPNIPYQDKFYPCIEHDLRTLTRYWQQWEYEQASVANSKSKSNQTEVAESYRSANDPND